jgi:replicative superfamily II helicase
MRKVLVGVAVDSSLRSAAEDMLVSNMPNGVTAVAAYQIGISKETAKDREALRAKLEAQQFDGMLVSRPVDSIVTETSVYGITSAQTMYDWYGYGYTTVQFGYDSEIHREYIVETRLYDLKTQKIVWATVTEMFDPLVGMETVKTLTDAISRKLDSTGIVRAK